MSTDSQPTHQTGTTSWALAAAGLVGAVLVVFGQVRGFAFINFDDNEYVTDNPFVRDGLSAANIRYAFTHFYAGHFHPLTWLTHMADVSAFGMDAGAHHAVNLLFHTVNTVVFLVLMRRFGLDLRVSVALTALFALHPLRAESVAWVTGRKDMLSMLLLLATLHAYTTWVQTRRTLHLALTWVAHALALLSKPTVIVVPVLLLLLDHWPLQRPRSWRPLLLEKVPLFMLSLASAASSVLGQQAASAMPDPGSVPLGLRVGNALTSSVGYLGQWVWPWELAAFYPLKTPPPGTPVVAALLLLTVTALVWHQRFRRPWLLTGWGIYAAALLPVVGLVQVGGQAMADRYLFIPSLGLGFVAVMGARELAARHWIIERIAVVWLAALMVVCAWQVSHWQSSGTLWRRALEVVPDNYMAHNNLGVALEAEGNAAEAAAQYEEAVRLNPTWPTARNNLGNALALRGDYEQAATHYTAALARQPSLIQARYNLALARAFQGRRDVAEAGFRDVLVQAPDYLPAHFSLADALWKRGALEEALPHLQYAVERNPGWADARRRYALLLAALKSPQAPAELQHALRLMPQDAELRSALNAVIGP